MTVRAAHHRRLMQPALVTLMRAVGGRMAIHAARIGQHPAEFGEHRGRALIDIADRKTFRGCQRVCLVAETRVARQQAPRARRPQSRI